MIGSQLRTLLLVGLIAAAVAVGCAGASKSVSSEAQAPAATSTLPATTTPIPSPTTTTTGRRPAPDPTPPPSTTTRPPATPTVPPASSTGSGCPNNSLEGCYNFAGMQAFLGQAQGLVDSFFTAQYSKMPLPRVTFVSSGQAGRTACGAVDSQAYEYCGANDSVYIGQDLLWSFYHQFGDAAPVMALAHEFGHHLQAALRLPQPRTAAQSVQYEDQADCIAGAFTQYAGQKGWLEAGDLNDVESLLSAIGSRESVRRDHGTVAERKASFQKGYEGGLAGCNSFFPANPIYGAA